MNCPKYVKAAGIALSSESGPSLGSFGSGSDVIALASASRLAFEVGSSGPKSAAGTERKIRPNGPSNRSEERERFAPRTPPWGRILVPPTSTRRTFAVMLVFALLLTSGWRWLVATYGARTCPRLRASLGHSLLSFPPIRLSSPLDQPPEARAMAAASNRHVAASFAANILPTVRKIQSAGATSYQAVAQALNVRCVRTARGGAWHSTTVRNLVMCDIAL